MFRDWLRHVRRYAIYSTAVLLTAVGSVRAESPDELKARIEAQESEIQAQKRELQELKAMIRGGVQPAATVAADPKLDDAAVRRVVDGYMVEKQQQQKAAEAEAQQKLETEGFKVGSDLRMSARWDYWNGVVFETPNKDFTYHVGGRIQEDTVAFTQSPGLKNAPPVGIGDLQDGTYFRRIRTSMDGTFWQVFEFKMEVALEQVKEGVVTLDEMYVGMKDIPWLGTVRAGHMRVLQGLEGDLMSSSKDMTFMEKSYETDAFFQNFAPGILFTNSVLDQHMTYGAEVYRQEFADHNNDGADFGDGKYATAGRLTFLPLYENDGMQLLHIGVSGTWRKAEDPDPGLAGPGVVDFSARPLMRDAIGDYGGLTIGSTATVPTTTAGKTATVLTAATLPGNKAKLVDTGKIQADSTAVIGTELFYVCGPFSLQSEWAFAYINDATPVGSAIPESTRSFNGGYIQASYFLTGEHRTYDRRLGRLDSNYFSGPNTNFWFTKDEDGHYLVGRGAWEIAARLDYLNLNDGPIHGGVVAGAELALNWYLNPNVKIQFEYMTNNRYSMPVGEDSGVVQGFGTRLQLNF